MPSPDFNRRAFLRGESPTFKSSAIRPPWTVELARFIDNCERCDECIKACPENILFRGDGGYPEINFTLGECTFCGKCADICKADAFHSGERDIKNAWSWYANVKPSCLSLNAIVCRACGDNCEEDAIRFQLQVGGKAIPLIDTDECTGCGACLFVCPENAISMLNNL
jgi:ferredoxin-type protein NapF